MPAPFNKSVRWIQAVKKIVLTSNVNGITIDSVAVNDCILQSSLIKLFGPEIPGIHFWVGSGRIIGKAVIGVITGYQ
jgi:hypothetical protein